MSVVEAPARGLLGELRELPVSRAVAVHVVRVVDDPEASAQGVARAVGADPALTARVMRLANSAYYGLSGRVGSPSFAVTVVGLNAVRSLATLRAAGLDQPGSRPPGFWSRAAAASAASAAVAPACGADPSEAFCVGLLHELGSALLRQHDRRRFDVLHASARAQGRPVEALERLAWGTTHADVVADLLGSWHFPAHLCEALRHQRRPSDLGDPPLLRALHAGLVVAELDEEEEPSPEQLRVLAHAGLAQDRLPLLRREVERARVELAAALEG